jgi:hypothetical protein
MTDYRDVAASAGNPGQGAGRLSINSNCLAGVSTTYICYKSNKILIYSPKSLSDIAPKFKAVNHPEVIYD